MSFFPKRICNWDRTNLEGIPPNAFITGLMKLPVMTATERDSELIANFKADGSGLRKAQMMRVGGLPPAN
jgi:hypothetical protein